jgi:hypothetical protein
LSSCCIQQWFANKQNGYKTIFRAQVGLKNNQHAQIRSRLKVATNSLRSFVAVVYKTQNYSSTITFSKTKNAA